MRATRHPPHPASPPHCPHRFHRDWVRAVFAAPGGALSVSGAGKFNVPGPYSLAFRLITAWAGSLPGEAASKLDGGSGGSGCSSGTATMPLPLPASFTASAPTQAAAAAAASADGEWEGDRIPQVRVCACVRVVRDVFPTHGVMGMHA